MRPDVEQFLRSKLQTYIHELSDSQRCLFFKTYPSGVPAAQIIPDMELCERTQKNNPVSTNSGHSEEPWSWRKMTDPTTGNPGYALLSKTGDAILWVDECNSPQLTNEMDSDRIINCVNSCKGITPKRIPDLILSMKGLIAELRFHDDKLWASEAANDAEDALSKMKV